MTSLSVVFVLNISFTYYMYKTSIGYKKYPSYSVCVYHVTKILLLAQANNKLIWRQPFYFFTIFNETWCSPRLFKSPSPFLFTGDWCVLCVLVSSNTSMNRWYCRLPIYCQTRIFIIDSSKCLKKLNNLSISGKNSG